MISLIFYSYVLTVLPDGAFMQNVWLPWPFASYNNKW